MPRLISGLKDLLKKILAEDASASSIARGFAAGIFLGLLPLIGVQMILVVFICQFIKANRLAAVAGVWITNPLTFIPIYSFNYWLGLRVLSWNNDPAEFRAVLDHLSIMKLINLSAHILLPLTVGSVIVAVIAALASYFPIKKIVEIRHIRMLERAQHDQIIRANRDAMIKGGAVKRRRRSKKTQ